MLLFFKGRSASAIASCIKVNGAIVHISDNAVHLTSDRLKDLTLGLSKLIDTRDGYKECDRLTCDDIYAFILDLCRNLLFLCCIECFTVINIAINTCTIYILHNCITMCE